LSTRECHEQQRHDSGSIFTGTLADFDISGCITENGASINNSVTIGSDVSGLANVTISGGDTGATPTGDRQYPEPARLERHGQGRFQLRDHQFSGNAVLTATSAIVGDSALSSPSSATRTTEINVASGDSSLNTTLIGTDCHGKTIIIKEGTLFIASDAPLGSANTLAGETLNLRGLHTT
jgi:hypothetical protein